MNNFRTYNLAINFYKECEKLHVNNVLRNQLTRASSSIALNLAEGRGRKTLLDQKHFFQIALGSARECKAILDLTINPPKNLINQADSICAHIYKLIKNAC